MQREEVLQQRGVGELEVLRFGAHDERRGAQILGEPPRGPGALEPKLHRPSSSPTPGQLPGNAVSAIGVASTVDSLQLRDGLRVRAPARSRHHRWPDVGRLRLGRQRAHTAPGERHRDHSRRANADGCEPFCRSGQGEGHGQGRLARVGRRRRHPTLRLGRSVRQRRRRGRHRARSSPPGWTSSAAGITGDDTIPVFQLHQGRHRQAPRLRRPRAR